MTPASDLQRLMWAIGFVVGGAAGLMTASAVAPGGTGLASFVPTAFATGFGALSGAGFAFYLQWSNEKIADGRSPTNSAPFSSREITGQRSRSTLSGRARARKSFWDTKRQEASAKESR